MTNNTSGEWLAPVTPLHRVSFTEVVDTVDDVPELDHDSEEPADEVDAQTIAIRALARRAMSVREMERLLRDRGASADEVANEVARLESVGLLNDDDLALDLAERLQTRKGMGASAIKSELFKRMVKTSSIDLAIESLPGDQSDLCLTQARERLGRLRGLDREVQYRRLHSYLARRGFRGSDITSALREVLGSSRGSAAPEADNVITVTFRDSD
ncbi:MAG: regulatory protein RecX [Microbacteriaceae bacterium]|jgi:regulatory protein